jgi:hypothetical protein
MWSWRILFGAYLRKEIVNKDESRIKRLWVSRDEIGLFAEHCVYIRSVFEYYVRIFVEGTKAEYAAMEAVAPRFFEPRLACRARRLVENGRTEDLRPLAESEHRGAGIQRAASYSL